MTPATAKPSSAERRRQQTLERRKQTAAEVMDGPPTAVTVQRHTFTAQVHMRALPRDLLEQGAIAFDPQGQPRVAQYHPTLLAPNPQRARQLDRGLAELAASLDTHGQQEPIVARLITDTDRNRWPDAFNERHILLILKGHRIFFAQPKSKLSMLRVELMLPEEAEDEITYSRRALRRASIKMMHSQSYDIFDKVALYEIWRQEFSLERPKDAEVATYFEISRQEAQRIKTVALLDTGVAQEIVNADQELADEVIYLIANRPPEEHRDAFTRYGNLTVAAARRLHQLEMKGNAEAKLTGPGRPRNFVLSVRDEDSDVTYISTALTALQWKRKGGSRAFWKAIQKLVNTRQLQDRLQKDLG